jgi:hypothetical protein
MDIINTASALMSFLDKCAYGFVDCKTKSLIPESMADFRYRTLSPKQFMRLQVGVCWDFVLFEYAFLKDRHPDGQIKCVFADFGRDGTPTHTFLYFHCDGGWVWFENAWGVMHGMRMYKSEKELVSDFRTAFARYYKIGEAKVRLKWFSPDKSFYGLTPTDFKGKCLAGNSVRLFSASDTVVSELRHFVKKVKARITADAKPPTGNQNCMLCTWCVEMWFRGSDALPRPVYSPADPVFRYEGHEFVKDTVKLHPKDKRGLLRIVREAGSGARFYTHVNWRGRQSGHEFLIVNLDSEPYVVDGQAGFCEKATAAASAMYFDANWDNSFMMRIDGKELDKNVVKLNEKKYLKEFEEKDLELLK